MFNKIIFHYKHLEIIQLELSQNSAKNKSYSLLVKKY